MNMLNASMVGFLLIAAMMSNLARAHEAGTWLVRGGVGSVMPQESSGDVLGTGEFEVSNDTQPTGTISYMYTDHVGFETIVALPFVHDVSTPGLGKIAEVSQLPFSFMVQYYFGEATSDIRPYVGGGVNYAVFFDEETEGNLASDTASVDASFGLAAHVGVDVTVSNQWFVNASLWYLDVDTTIKTQNSGNFDITLDPIAVVLAAGYQF
ncbi:OmpW family outer membrane protein [Marinomonas sp. THO17]|uniref:OmpW family outer membrane protein n=1 Tax=Marinomonas sp. THO17 TaxID=3149048 RepID=UPI00336C07B0